MILKSVENGPLLWLIVEENGVTRLKKYSELSTTKAIQADCDERIQMLMQGTSLTKQERKCKLYDEFDKFAYRKGESLRDFYLRFSLLLNDMNIYNMKLEQFQAQPIEKHVHAVKRIFRYLLESLIFSVALTAFADADHAGCQDTRRNTSGSVQFLRERLISWSSKKQKSVAISSTKADTSPYLDVVHKFYGCDHNFRTMALDSTKFQCTAIIKVILPYAAIMSNTLGLSISTSDTTLSRSRLRKGDRTLFRQHGVSTSGSLHQSSRQR
nr:putative mitochondrial protein [Tanacetum cinerariifolium]